MNKRILIVLMLVLTVLPVVSQNFVSIFMNDIGRKSTSGAMQVNISGRMIRYAAKNDPDIDKEMKKLLEGINQICMVAGLPTNEDLLNRMETLLEPYEELISVMEDEQSIRMFTKETDKGIEEFVLCVSVMDAVTLMSITGNIDLKQISRLSESVKIQGAEHLHLINDKEKKK